MQSDRANTNSSHQMTYAGPLSPKTSRDLPEEMVRKRIVGAERFIQLSFEVFAALAPHGMVRGTKVKPFCEGLFRIVGLDDLGADLDLRRGRRPAHASSVSSIVPAISSETSAAVPPSFSSSTAPARSKTLSPVRTWLSWRQQDCSSGTFMEFSLTLVAHIKVCSRDAASAGNRSSEAKAASRCHAAIVFSMTSFANAAQLFCRQAAAPFPKQKAAQ